MTILFVSQDGIADHIGQSQIAPYILGLAERGYDMHLLSAEKAGTEAIAADYRARFAAAGVRWTTVRYHKPLLGTARDLIAMTRAARRISRREHIEIVHCRGHPTVPVGMAVKRWTGARLLFDVRDLWADQGIRRGRFVPVYRAFKRLERPFVRASDHVNCLTERAAAYLRERYVGADAVPSFSVVPCCADFALFRPMDAAPARTRLSIDPHATVMLYLGSISANYMVPEMIALFVALRRLRPEAVFLLVCNNGHDEVRAAADAAGVPREALRIVGASRAEIPGLIAAADLSVAFKRADLSNIGTSPTKIGETLACGVPVIANSGVGDLDAQLSPDINGSLALADFTPEMMRAGLEHVLRGDRTRAEIRTSSLALSLESGIDAYAAVYEALRAGEA